MSVSLPKTLALVRIAVGLLFIVFGQYKVMGSEFVSKLLPQWVERSVKQDHAVSFYQPFLAKVVLPNAELFGYLVAWGELLIGVALVVGFWVRAASLLGALHMVNLTLASWWAPGSEEPFWRYFANQLDHLPLLFLFLLFFAGRAGEVWGLDARARHPPKSKPKPK